MRGVSVDGKKPLGLFDQAAFLMLRAPFSPAGSVPLLLAPAALMYLILGRSELG